MNGFTAAKKKVRGLMLEWTKEKFSMDLTIIKKEPKAEADEAALAVKEFSRQ